jgi:uncharacterized membrane protein
MTFSQYLDTITLWVFFACIYISAASVLLRAISFFSNHDKYICQLYEDNHRYVTRFKRKGLMIATFYYTLNVAPFLLASLVSWPLSVPWLVVALAFIAVDCAYHLCIVTSPWLAQQNHLL